MNKKEQQAIDFLRSMERDDLLSLGFSGGKDSVVILDLAERAGIKYNAIYANTTVDPPGTISFIKRHYPQVRIIHPEKSFFQLVEEKGLPSRLRRFCCERLKERYGIGKRSIEGMRAAESRNRKDYEPEQCDTRKWMKGAKHILPILTWAEEHPITDSNGCKFCKGESVTEWGCLGRSRKGRLKYGYKEIVEPVDFGNTCSLTITGTTLNVDYNAYSADSSFYDEIAINFCPMCGRKLNEVENNENK